MKRAERIKLAASRFGLASPTPDAIISAAWPKYHWWKDASGNMSPPEPSHIAGYHRDFSEVVRLAQTLASRRACKWCGETFTEARGNRRYCDKPACRKASYTHRSEKKAHNTTPASPQERARIVELYVSGLSVLRVSAETGRSPTAIYNALKDAAIERRPYEKKGGPVRRIYLPEGARGAA